MSEKLNNKSIALMNERFHHDCLISVATTDENGVPYVRTVDSFYEDGSFYTVTYALSGKMQQIAKNPTVAVCGDWFTAHGKGENMGHVLEEKNKEIMEKLRSAFAAWYSEGDVNESDVNTCILRIRLTDGLLLSHGTRFEIDFT